MSEFEGEVVEMQESSEEIWPVETKKLEEGAEAPEPKPRQAETQKLEDVTEIPSQALAPVAAAPHLGLTRHEMTWAAVAHASILVTFLLALASGGVAALLGPIIPALIWYSNRDKSEYVMEQARQATIFQVAGILLLLALALGGALLLALGWAITAALSVILIGLILIPVMLIVSLLWVVALVALPIGQVIYGCYAALETYNGRPFRYRWVADMIDRYLAQT